MNILQWLILGCAFSVPIGFYIVTWAVILRDWPEEANG